MTVAVVIFVVVAFAGLYADSRAAEPQVTLHSPRWVPPLIRRLAVCETRGNPKHRSGSYGGVVGWYVGTWQLDRYDGMPRYPWNATLRQQVRVAQRSIERGRFFGCLHGAEHAWVRG